MKSLQALLLCLVVAACSDVHAPAVDDEVALSLTDRMAEKHEDATVIETIVLGDALGGPSGINPADSPDNTVEQSESAPALETYHTGFTVVQGERTIFIVYYQGKKKNRPFLLLDIPATAQLLREDGTAAGDGEAIYISVEIDPAKFLVHFGPHGSTFVDGARARLRFYYSFAELNGLDPANLNVWYQPQTGKRWKDIPTSVEARDRYLLVKIRHFSNYAIAF